MEPTNNSMQDKLSKNHSLASDYESDSLSIVLP